MIVESPVHNTWLPQLTDQQIQLVIEAWQGRFLALSGTPETRYVVVFGNYGVSAGRSLVHPHSQIVAIPFVPTAVERRRALAKAHHAATGNCLLCKLAEKERRASVRVVEETERFVAFCPYAAGQPGEVWIVPRNHRTSFADPDDGMVDQLASIMRQLLTRLAEGFGNPSFNYIVHSELPGRSVEHVSHGHWFVQVLPRLAQSAGFELASGIQVNPMPPEEAATLLRSVIPPGR